MTFIIVQRVDFVRPSEHSSYCAIILIGLIFFLSYLGLDLLHVLARPHYFGASLFWRAWRNWWLGLRACFRWTSGRLDCRLYIFFVAWAYLNLSCVLRRPLEGFPSHH